MVGDHQVGRYPGQVRKPSSVHLLQLALLTVIAALQIAPDAASAQDYPTHPITLLVPYAAGGRQRRDRAHRRRAG